MARKTVSLKMSKIEKMIFGFSQKIHEFGNAKVFGSIGIPLAFYITAKPQKRKQILSFLFPATLTAVLFGITEP